VCMFLDIRLLEQKPVRFNEIIAPGAIRFDTDIAQLGDLQAAGNAEYHEAAEEIRVRGEFSVPLQFTCDRCAEPFRTEIIDRFDLIYEPEPEAVAGQEIAIKHSESEIGYYKWPGFELNDILEEQVLLAVPMQRLCRADCKGICPVCGQNRNEQDCSCQSSPADERWAALKNFQKVK